MAEYLSQDLDYYDALRTKLGDLEGADTLIHELAQNAHDAYRDADRQERATRIIFDICDDGLRVWNDGVFSSCGDVSAPECSWQKGNPSHERCDFHRFRRVASGDKARAENVFGAFGVGFISVYQITDKPEFRSSGMHWTLNPAEKSDQRIRSELDGENRPGTEFWLPWAPEVSELGTILKRAARTREDHIRLLVAQGPDVAEQAIMFLENIESIEIRRNGEPLSSIAKTEADEELVVDRDGKTQSWLLVRGEFEGHKRSADALLDGELSRRSATATVAIPENPGRLEGLLFCGLPTRQPTQLPFHINAHFFPSSDRKRIDVEGDSYKVEWNRAAIEASAVALASNLEQVAGSLGPVSFWSMLSRLYAQNQRSDVQDVFWQAVEKRCPGKRIVLSSREQWLTTPDVCFLQRAEEEQNLEALEALDIHVAHPDLRSHQSTMRALRMVHLEVSAITEAVTLVARSDKHPVAEAHPALSNEKLRLQVGDALQLRLERDAEERCSTAREQLGSLAICLTVEDKLAPPNQLLGPPTDAETDAFRRMGLGSVVAASLNHNHPSIRSLVPSDYRTRAVQFFSLMTQRRSLEQLRAPLRELFRWLRENQLGAIREDENLRRTLASAPIWPAASRLHVLSEVSIPGGFRDTLGLACTLDTEFADGVADAALALGCKQLSVADYAADYVPRLFATGRPSREQAAALLADLASQFAELSASRRAREVLASLTIVPCSDGDLRRPNEVVFDSPETREILGPNAPMCAPQSEIVRSLLEWLGVSDSVTVPAILSRVRMLSQEPVNPTTVGAAQSALRRLAGLNTISPLEQEVLVSLRNLRWLPAVDDDEWHRPSELLTVFQREVLFGRHGLQLDLPRLDQQSAAALLKALNLRNDPSADEAVDYLLELLERDEEPSPELYKFLDRTVEPSVARRLAGIPLFLGVNGQRYTADRAFLGQHPFGDWAVTLDATWGALSALLRALRIRQEPNAEDAARVLAYMEHELSGFHQPLEQTDIDVVNACWSLIGWRLDHDSEVAAAMGLLEGREVALDSRGVLVAPDTLFFNDQPEIARHLEDRVGPILIARKGDAWRGLAHAGVCDISSAIGVEVLDVQHGAEATERFHTMLGERRSPIVRALAQDSHLADPEQLLDSWLDISFIEVEGITVRLWISRPSVEVTTNEMRGALLDRGARNLYVVQSEPHPAAAIARELLTGASVEAGYVPLLVTALAQVLGAPSAAAADEDLDVRGFARFESRRAPTPGLTSEEAEGVDNEEDVPADSDSSDVERARSEQSHGDVVPARRPQRRDERLRSYVAVSREETLDPEAAAAEQERRLAIDRAGAERVMAYERSKGRTPEKMAHLNKGFDIRSEDDLGRVRFIEVKSTANLWGDGGVGVSPAQHDYARRNPDEWWLYVVEAAESDEFWAIYCINNFVERTSQYMFDDGWRVAAKEKAGAWKGNEEAARGKTSRESDLESE